MIWDGVCTYMACNRCNVCFYGFFSGVGAPRAFSVSGNLLPSPRLISTNVHSDTSRPHTRYSLMVMQFAQITDHDLTFTPVNKGKQSMTGKFLKSDEVWKHKFSSSLISEHLPID